MPPSLAPVILYQPRAPLTLWLPAKESYEWLDQLELVASFSSCSGTTKIRCLLTRGCSLQTHGKPWVCPNNMGGMQKGAVKDVHEHREERKDQNAPRIEDWAPAGVRSRLPQRNEAHLSPRWPRRDRGKQVKFVSLGVKELHFTVLAL